MMQSTRKEPRNPGGILLGLAALALLAAGCTSRAITVTSLPEGAEVSINRRVVGKTPIRVPYTHYGSYRIELRKDRFEPKIATAHIRPPWYGYDPISFIPDNVLPARINDESSLHYVMKPVQETDRDQLLARAESARDGKAVHPLSGKEVAITFQGEGDPHRDDLEQTRKLGVEGPAPAPDLEPPTAEPDKGKPPTADPGTIKEQPPQGPQLSKELGLEAPKKEPEKKPKSKEEEQKNKRMRRTPQGEILIYDQEPVEDPDKSK